MIFKKEINNIFSDKASIIIRKMLEKPKKKWQTKDFNEYGISLGMASMVLKKAESFGYVNRVSMGRNSCSILSNKEGVLKDWQAFYRFDRNPNIWFFHNDKNIIKNCIKLLNNIGINYALTLYSASRLISPYVKDDKEYIYLDIKKEDATKVMRTIKDRLLLNRLVAGGNICFAVPYYRNSVFKDSRTIFKSKVVSNLQLYLDLMGFPPAGIEEAMHLKEYWKKAGEEIA